MASSISAASLVFAGGHRSRFGVVRRAITAHPRNVEAPPGGEISTCPPGRSKRQVQFDPIMRHPRRDPPPFTPFKADEAVAGHGLQGARQVRLRLPGDPRQFVERARSLLGDHSEQVAIAG